MSIRARSARYFSATIVAALISFVTLPLTTNILGPSSYGILALGSALAGVGAYIATLGMSFVTANRWPGAGRDERRRIVGTLLAIGTVIVVAWALAVALGFGLLHGHVKFLDPLTWTELALLLGGLLLSPGWTIAADVWGVEGRASEFAFINILAAILAAIATLAALYVFDAKTVSLFIGVFVSGAVGFVAFLWYFREYLGFAYDRAIRGELAQATFVGAQIAETVQSLVERVLLSRFVGFAGLGLFYHARRYREFGFQATNAVTRGVWPVTLAEAKDRDGVFPATGRTWRMVYVWLTAGAIGATAVGDRFIALLTHGKFTHAWIYLAPWFLLMLVQLSAKPEVGALYAFGQARTTGRLSLASNLLGIVGALAFIPWLGTGGALVALGVQWLSYRLMIRIPARRLRSIPFQDGWALAGCVVLLAVYVVKLIVGRALGVEVGLLLVSEAVWLGAAAILSRDVFAVLPVRSANAA